MIGAILNVGEYKMAIKKGVWPTMITPFDKNLKIDYEAAKAVANWYIDNGVAGIFAVCQSSEMFFLTLEERVKLAKSVVEAAGGDKVIASGQISTDVKEKAKEINEIASTGVSAVVLLTNRFANRDESDDVWKRNMENIIESIPKDIELGLYECPYPYKRILSTETIKWCAKTGRFSFYKDTSCKVSVIKERIKAAEGSGFKIFNANSATLLDTLKEGAHGYSGIMANFHPHLYVWMCSNYNVLPENAKLVSNYLGLASIIECRKYPKCAKYAMKQMGLPVDTYSRICQGELPESVEKEVLQLIDLTNYFRYNLIENDLPKNTAAT